MNPTEPIIANFQYSLNFLKELVDDLSEDQMVSQTELIKNHPAWVIGHLTFSCQAIGGELGIDRWLPADWGKRFGMGSAPVDDVRAYEGKDTLLSILADAESRIISAVESLTPEQLAQPLPDENYRDLLPTTHHAIGQILIAHTAYHIGQTTLWRRAFGLSKMTNPFL